MNGRTAKLLRRWAKMKRFNYRRVKRTWAKRSRADKDEIRAEIKNDIQRNTK